jgi:small subunit ribosomal protein S7
MPRTKAIRKRQVKPDPIYSSEVVEKLVNRLMQSGKKETARKIVYGALEEVAKGLATEPVSVLTQALLNTTPKQEVRSRRVGGATYQIPMPVKETRGQTLAIRWIVQAAQARSGRPMVERLAEELKDAYNSEGGAVKKKEDVHRMAEANRAFAHFRW